MERTQKIALIGAKTYERQTPTQRVYCYAWDNLCIANLRDYDLVILNLLSIKDPASVDWRRFHTILNFASMRDILRVDSGSIIVLGDPRFSIRRQDSQVGHEIVEPFLAWSGITFRWDNQPGDTVHNTNDWDHRYLKDYLKQLKRWRYSLRSVEPNLPVVGRAYDLTEIKKNGLTPRVRLERFSVNRYDYALAFAVNLTIERWTNYEWERSVDLGPIMFLPETNLTEDQTLVLVLRDLCGIEAPIPEPEWVAQIQAPGQKAIDAEIADIKERIGVLMKTFDEAQDKRAEVRLSLKLLYERGDSLEKAVRQILGTLGADVEDPASPGKEDGWLTVRINGRTLEGVLEVKSTKNAQFGEDGLRQLLDWVGRGVELRQKKYKGIFIGNNSVDSALKERPAPFSDNWEKSCEMHTFVALTSEDLYYLHVLNAKGILDTNILWQDLFETNGVFDIAKYIPSPTN